MIPSFKHTEVSEVDILVAHTAKQNIAEIKSRCNEGIKQWNSLPATLATAPSLNVFKSGVCELKVVAMDLSKAFDSLPHSLLISKLWAYGLDNCSCAILQDYLPGRYQ